MGDLTVRPRLLFLCQTLPYPPDGGVWIRTYHVLRLLARAFDITALCFERATTARRDTARQIAVARRGLGQFAAVEVFAIPQYRSHLRYAWDHLRSVARRRVYTMYLYESPHFQRRLTELVRTVPFDLVHVDSLDLARYLPACHGLPVVCVHHDVESALLRRRGALERRRWRRVYIGFQAGLMEDVERRWCERIDLNVMVSARDAALLRSIAPASAVAIVPNGVDIDEFRPDDSQGTGLAFVGGTNLFPNRDALEFFCAEILPRVRAAHAQVATRWIGHASAEQRQHYRKRHGVELTGYVDDVRPFLREAACHIVPLRAGGGTRLKIINAWALGKPVVSTSVGCEGLDAVDGDNILIRDDARGFADAIVRVLADDQLRRRLGARGRATAERLYSWDVIGARMIETYRLASAGPRPDAAVGGAIGASACR